MEVNHRVPCRGKHGTLSCDHHLDNLETLCVACHKILTLTARKAPPEPAQAEPGVSGTPAAAAVAVAPAGVEVPSLTGVDVWSPAGVDVPTADGVDVSSPVGAKRRIPARVAR